MNQSLERDSSRNFTGAETAELTPEASERDVREALIRHLGALMDLRG